MLHPFVQSIAHINDSATFESSFEVKYIQSTPQRLKNRCINECDRENLRRFVQEFEDLQAYNSSAKSTPKKFKHLYDQFVIIGNKNSRSLNHTPVCQKDNSERIISSSPSSPFFILSDDMGCKPITCCDDEEPSDDNLQLTNMNANESPDSSFDMHPPLLPSFNITPPKQQRNAVYELARFLRGSFHVKRAKITHLRRSLSDNENFQNIDFTQPLPTSAKCSRAKDTAEKSNKKVLEDATNRSRGSTSSICVSIS